MSTFTRWVNRIVSVTDVSSVIKIGRPDMALGSVFSLFFAQMWAHAAFPVDESERERRPVKCECLRVKRLRWHDKAHCELENVFIRTVSMLCSRAKFISNKLTNIRQLLPSAFRNTRHLSMPAIGKSHNRRKEELVTFAIHQSRSQCHSAQIICKITVRFCR